MTTDLSDLCTALAAAAGPSRELDERMSAVFGFEMFPPQYTSSLDAITGAVEQRWPGGNWTVKLVREQPQGLKGYAEVDTAFWSEAQQKVQTCWAKTTALALCLAAVRLAETEQPHVPPAG